MVKVAYVKTVDENNVLCRVKVSTLDRAYGVRRELKKLAEKHPEDSRKLEDLCEKVGLLFTDAHNYSKGVPLSYSEFCKIGLRELPNFAKPDESGPRSR